MNPAPAARGPTLALRTHVAILTAFLLLFSLSAALTYFSHARVHQQMETVLSRDLGVMKDLPRRRVEQRQAVADDIEREEAARQADYKERFLLRLAVEFLAAGFFALYLFFFILRPMLAVERAFMGWTLGQPWPRQTARAIPEFKDMLARFEELTQRLNSQYEKEKELGEFKTQLVALVSHEFANALSVIHNSAYVLRRKASPAELRANGDLYRAILSNTESLYVTIHSLLGMDRINAGAFAAEPQVVPLAKLIGDCVERMGAMAGSKSLRVEVGVDPDCGAVKADPATLGLALSNLLSNALKYTPPGGRVVVGARKVPEPPSRCRIFVEDTGIGLAQAERDRILNGHYRAENGRRMTRQGFGIGLSLARRIIESHGSALELVSAPGKGSAFSFLLPIETPRESTAPEPASALLL